MRPPNPLPAGPGQESVWDYPRPPRVEPTTDLIEVEFGGQGIASTGRALRVLETSHPPTYYLPMEDVVDGALRPAPGSSFCEWKGRAALLDVLAGGRVAPRSAWTYPRPAPPFQALAGHVAVYAAAMDRCTVGCEVVVPQPGEFYGGWITSRVVGPFKGTPGSSFW